MSKKPMHIDKQLALGLGMLIALLLLVGGYSIFRSNSLATLTHQLYWHPFAVSNGARDLRANILAIHRSMMDVTQAENEAEITAALEVMTASEKDALKTFDLVAERFLGDKIQVEIFKKEFMDWSTIRSDVIKHVRKGERKQAIAITKGKGAEHVTMLNQHADALVAFASKKGEAFYAMTGQKEKQALITTGALLFLSVLTACTVSLFLSRSVIERRRTQEALNENALRFRRYFDLGLIGMAITSVEKKWVEFNDTLHEMFGYSREEFATLTWEELTHPDSLEVDLIQFNRVMAGEINEYSLEKRFIHKDGSIIHADISATAIRKNDGSVDYFVASIYDITPRKQMEERVRQLEKMNAIGQLASGVAHDFNNILAGIMGAAELLNSSKNQLDPEAKEFIDIIITSTNRAADLTSKLLAFGRKGIHESRTVSVHAIVNDAVGILKNTIDKKISITVKTEASADEATGDSSGIQNAILNLGINASHAMPDGGSLQISTRNVSLDDTYCTISTFDLIPGDYIEIEIKDNGSGIAPQNLDRIYEPFFTTKKQGEGSGLGLAAVYGTVQDHHGAITVYSEKDTGTVFHLYLPCSEKKKPNTPSKSEVIMGKGTILLVDDEDALLAIGKMTLEHLGYQVLQASNGAEARDLFREKHREIDLVIMDMIMPVMNGKDAFLEMKKIDPDCKVIIASGFSKSENLDELRDAGLAGFILKPFRSVALSQLIAEQLAPTDTSSSA